MENQVLVEKIKGSKGKIFSVVFKKRGDGSLRKMVCRTGVRKHLRGGDARYNFSEKGLISVFDVQKKDYRTIATESIVEVKIDKQTFTI